VENLCNLEKFRIFLKKEPKEFNRLIKNGNQELIINLFCALEEKNIDKIVTFIKDDELHGSAYILDNLLQLEPVSLPIIDRFINSIFLDEGSFIERVDKVRKISSNILETLTVEKKKIRKDAKDKNSNVNNSSDLLQQVMDEIKKHSKKLEELKEKQKKDKELESIKIQILEIEKELDIKNIEEMDEKLKYYKNKKKSIDKIQEEINESKELFTSLPKDGA